MEPTNIAAPDYFHKVVDCQWACPAHTPVPEYIRLIAAGRYSDPASSVEVQRISASSAAPATSRASPPPAWRVENEPVICRPAVAADYKGDISAPAAPGSAQGSKRVALVGGGPASSRRTRSHAAGYQCTVFVPTQGRRMIARRFALPPARSVIDEECEYILDLKTISASQRTDSLKTLAEDWDASLIAPARRAAGPHDSRPHHTNNIHIGIDWLASVSFSHINKIGRRVIGSAAATPWIAAVPRAPRRRGGHGGGPLRPEGPKACRGEGGCHARASRSSISWCRRNSPATRPSHRRVRKVKAQ
jgi:hypothetical protein